MKFRNALVAATILAMPLAAKAQPITGLYIGAGAGVNIMLNQNATVTSPAAVNTGNGHLDSRVGPAVAISMGYGFENVSGQNSRVTTATTISARRPVRPPWAVTNRRPA